jgi:hypothetical protein
MRPRMGPSRPSASARLPLQAVTLPRPAILPGPVGRRCLGLAGTDPALPVRDRRVEPACPGAGFDAADRHPGRCHAGLTTGSTATTTAIGPRTETRSGSLLELGQDVDVGSVAQVERAVSRGALGFLAAPDVSHRVRALEVDGLSLFGNDRLRGIDRWPLRVDPGLTDPPRAVDAWHQARTCPVAGGDLFTDRGFMSASSGAASGVDSPFDGGRHGSPGTSVYGPSRAPGPTYQLTVIGAPSADLQGGRPGHRQPREFPSPRPGSLTAQASDSPASRA